MESIFRKVLLCGLFALTVWIPCTSGGQLHKWESASTWFPPPELARKTAGRIVERFTGQRECGRLCFIDNDVGFKAAAEALALLGWPAVHAFIETYEANPSSRDLDGVFGWLVLTLHPPLEGDFKGKRGLIGALKEYFANPPSFPSNDELGAMGPDELELEGVLAMAGRTATPDAKRVLQWHLEGFDKLVSQHCPSVDHASLLMRVDSLGIGPPTPGAIPILLKFALNPYGIDAIPVTGPARSVDLRRGAVRSLALMTEKMVSATSYISLVEGSRQDAGHYVQLAASHGVRLDPEILRELLAPGSGADRVQIAEALGKSGDRGYRRMIRPLLSDGEKNVRFAAARALAYLGDDSGIQLIKEDLSDTPKQSTWEYAIEALGKLGTKEACDYLCDCLEKEAGPGGKGHSRFRSLKKALRDTSENYFINRLFAIRAESGEIDPYIVDVVCEIADKRVLATVAKHLDDPNPTVKKVAAHIIVDLNHLKISPGQDSLEVAKKWWIQHTQK